MVSDAMRKCRACVEGVVETAAPGHHPACLGDCGQHGCPVPVPDIEQCSRCYGTGVVTACCGLPPGHDHPPECSQP